MPVVVKVNERNILPASFAEEVWLENSSGYNVSFITPTSTREEVRTKALNSLETIRRWATRSRGDNTATKLALCVLGQVNSLTVKDLLTTSSAASSILFRIEVGIKMPFQGLGDSAAAWEIKDGWEDVASTLYACRRALSTQIGCMASMPWYYEYTEVAAWGQHIPMTVILGTQLDVLWYLLDVSLPKGGVQ